MDSNENGSDSLKFLNVSQLSQVLQMDRATVSKYLTRVPSFAGEKNAKLYWCPLAVRVLIETDKRGKLSLETEMLLNSILSGALKITPPKKV